MKTFLIIISITVGIAVVLTTLFFKGPLFEKYIRNQIENANYCDTKDDCRRVNSKCPFDCYVSVNKNEVERINGLIKLYPRTCLYSCGPLKEVNCTDNKCQSQVIYE